MPNSEQYDDVMQVINDYDKSDLIDLIGMLMETSQLVTGIVYDQLVEKQIMN